MNNQHQENVNGSNNFKNDKNLKQMNKSGGDFFNKNNDNAIKSSRDFKSTTKSHIHSRQCKACDLKKRISMSEITHDEHVKFQFNVDINGIIIETKRHMKKLNYKKAYEMLKLPIIQGVRHSDIYYLFGEVNRIMKVYDDGEKYLLEALLFEKHSPYVFYSLGLLYQEINNFKESVSMFKHFMQILETSDAYFQMSKSYSGLKKYLKAATHITKAINLNPNCYDYFMFRAQIYDVMGFVELSNDDIAYAKSLRNV